MSKKLLSRWFIVSTLLVEGLLGLTSCAPAVVAEGQLKPTSNASATLPPYPGPTQFNPPLTLSPGPTRAVQKGWWAVTPLPQEQMTRGEMTEIRPTASPTPLYSIRNESKANSYGFSTYMLFMQNSKTGEEIRLGDDKGQAEFYAMTDQYVIWSYYRLTYNDNTSPQTGFYAYVLATGEQIPIGIGGHLEANGQWVIFIVDTGVKDHVGLRAHNLLTREDFLLAKALPEFAPWRTEEIYAINENKIAWVEVDPTTSELSINVYDLDKHTSRKLETPVLTQPLFISVSNEFVTWRDGFWKGYSLKQNALLTIPVIPPGWENVPIKEVKPVTAQGDRLYWAFKVDDEFHYFTAPIVPRGQGPQVTHVVPTPRRKPTVAVTPTPVPLPTAYP